MFSPSSPLPLILIDFSSAMVTPSLFFNRCSQSSSSCGDESHPSVDDINKPIVWTIQPRTMTNTGRQLWAGAEEIGLKVWYFGGKEEVPYEDLPRSDKRRKTTRNKKEEDVVRRRGRGKKCEGRDGSKLSYENKVLLILCSLHCIGFWTLWMLVTSICRRITPKYLVLFYLVLRPQVSWEVESGTEKITMVAEKIRSRFFLIRV